jgi:hypothetical protein
MYCRGGRGGDQSRRLVPISGVADQASLKTNKQAALVDYTLENCMINQANAAFNKRI